jgi:two-component system, NarL family, response regulator LiaR
MGQNIRILIADDHAIIRKGIRALLQTEIGIEVVGEARDGGEVIEAAAQLHPDVILMDLVMPPFDGVEAIHKILSLQPKIRILVLTSFATEDKIFPAIKAGATGYLLKDIYPEDLICAIRQVYHGECSLHPIIARKLLLKIAVPEEQDAPSDPLSKREIVILQLLAQGLSNQQISMQLTISEATVRTHVSHILNKLHLTNRTQAALYALHTGLALLEESVKTPNGL